MVKRDRPNNAHVHVHVHYVHIIFFVSIDATNDDGRLGRLVNDGWNGNENCVMKKIESDHGPKLVLFAKRDIMEKEQLLYDYGVGDLPWRNNGKYTVL